MWLQLALPLQSFVKKKDEDILLNIFKNGFISKKGARAEAVFGGAAALLNGLSSALWMYYHLRVCGSR